MAWFALSLRTPKAMWWKSDTQDTPPQVEYKSQEHIHDSAKVYETHTSHPSTNVYTLRIFDPSLRPNLIPTLRSAIAEQGGTVVEDLLEKQGFTFSMPPGSQNPLTGYRHATLLEEGCIQITKDEDGRRRSGSVGSCDDDDGGSVGEEEHENLHLKWRWTEVKK